MDSLNGTNGQNDHTVNMNPESNTNSDNYTYKNANNGNYYEKSSDDFTNNINNQKFVEQVTDTYEHSYSETNTNGNTYNFDSQNINHDKNFNSQNSVNYNQFDQYSNDKNSFEPPFYMPENKYNGIDINQSNVYQRNEWRHENGGVDNSALKPHQKEGLYKENVKKQKPHKGSSFKRFVAAVLIISLLGGPLVGLSIGAGKSLVDNYIIKNDKNTNTVDNPSIEANADKEEIGTKFAFTNNSNTPIIQNSDSVNVVGIVEAVEPSVVNISTQVVVSGNSGFFGYSNYEDTYSGSGIIFHEDNEKLYIVTNFHVIDGASGVYVALHGEEQIAASPVGGDKDADLAVISINKKDLEDIEINNYTVATFGDSDVLKVGEPAYAFGNALGEGKIVTDGIISALNKNVNIEGKELTFVQTSAAINPGNSGGALVNSNSEVIGINTAKIFSSRVEGIGYAIPSNIAKPIIEALINEGSVPKQPKPYLGISGGTVTQRIADAYGLPIASGVIITSITPGSGVDDAGIMPNDVITKMNGVAIRTIEELQNEVSLKTVGDKVQLTIIRNFDETINVEVELKDMNAVTMWE